MQSGAKSGLLVGLGVLVGSLGLRALTSNTAKKVYVQGVAKGLQAKSAYENIVEQAKAQVDDIVAEAKYINSTDAECTCAAEATEETPKKTKKA